MRLGQSQEISVTAKQNGEDLGRFIKSQTKKFIAEWGQKPGKEPHKLGPLENDIISALGAGAQGMFLWVTLQLEAIRDTERIKLDEDVRAALRHLPAGLIKSLDAVYARITSMEQTAKTVTTLVLKWLLCAQRPLSVEELISAVSRSIRGNETFSTTELLNCCCGLVVLDSESDVLRLSHTSVREYLESLSEFGSAERHSAVAGRCLGAYIWEGTSKDILIDYATVYWPIPCEAVGAPHRDAVLKAMLLEFFTKEEHFEDWLESLDGKLQSQEVRWHGDLTKKLNALSSSPPSPLFTISCFGLSEVLQNLSERGLLQNLELLNKHDASGLYLAAQFGHEDVVKALISLGCNISAACGRFGSAIKAAAFFGHCSIADLAGGHEDIIEALLRSGFRFSTQDEFNDALQFAGFKGHARLVEHLLQGKLGDCAPREDHDPLQVALHGRREKESKRLLAGYADINAEVGYFGNAFQAAIAGGKLSLVQLVHKEGASLGSRGGFGHPLRVAAIAGKDDVLVWLLDQGADPNVQDDELGDALQAAASKNHISTMCILLEHGANTDGHGGFFKNPMQAAAYAGHYQAVKLLLENHARINAPDRVDSLELAARYGDLQLIQKPIDQHWGPFGSFLQIFCERDNLEVVRFLLDNGADLEDTSGMNGNALQVASDPGHLDMVQFLLENGARIEAPGQENGNALQAAAGAGNLKIAKPLIQHGADVNAPGQESGNALQAAAGAGSLDIVKLLIQHGADVNAPGESTHIATALRISIVAGHLETVDFLLSEGAKLEAADTPSGSLLYLAAYYGQTEIVRMLLGRGADVHELHPVSPYSLDPIPKNALIAACHEGKVTTACLLLENDPWGYVSRGTFERAAKASVRLARFYPEVSSMLISEGARLGFGAHVFNSMVLSAFSDRSYSVLESIVESFPGISEFDFSGYNLLEEAAYQGDASTVASLLAKSTDPVSRNDALTGAVSAYVERLVELRDQSSMCMDHEETDKLLNVLRVLVESAADLKPREELVILLAPAILEKGDLQLLELVENQGLEMGPPVGSSQFEKILQAASRRGNLDMVEHLVGKAGPCGSPFYLAELEVLEFLLGLGFDQEVLNAVKDSLLLDATKAEDPETVQLLLREVDYDPLAIEAALELMFNGNDSNGCYSFKWTSSKYLEQPPRQLQCLLDSLRLKTEVGPICTRILSKSCKSLSDGSLTVLLTHGADPNTRDTNDEAPLYRASKNKRSAQVKILLEYGADHKVRGRKHGTALHAAAKVGALTS
ncbi:ankyrin repeat-containing domain protein [Phyllosticta citrichinensis]